MPIEIPTRDEVVERSKTDVQRAVEGGIDPFNKNNVVTAVTTANANRVFDFYIQLEAAIIEALPDTAVDFLDRWAAIYGLQRNPASSATGSIAITGVAGTSIPVSTAFTASDGAVYTTTVSSMITTIVPIVLLAGTLVRSGNRVTVTLATNPGLANNVLVTIAGVFPATFNVTDQEIVVTGELTFQYDNTGSDEANSGSGTLVFTRALVSVTSFPETGEDQNQSSGTTLTIQSPLVDVDDEAAVSPPGIEGGVDEEENDELRLRLLNRIQNPVAHYNVSDIRQLLLTITGTTRVFVFENTNPVSLAFILGSVTVFIMRDDDPNPIPTTPQVAEAQTLFNTIRPANTAEANAQVLAPIPVTTDFTFTLINPNTSTMRDAIRANILQFFAEGTAVSENVLEEQYTGAIINTVDTETGDVLISFTLAAPVGDIPIAAGEIGQAGVVTFT